MASHYYHCVYKIHNQVSHPPKNTRMNYTANPTNNKLVW